MTAHQCPRCELRFAWLTEMRWHLREDHPDFHVGEYRSAGETDAERPVRDDAPPATPR